METKWLTKKNNSSLLIFFSGWAFDERCVAHLKSENHDVVVFYDYRSLEFSVDTRNYTEITVIAWSFGIWVAEYILPDLSNLNYALAINGSRKAIDNQEGISEKIFQKTLENLNPATLSKFMIRICGGIQMYHQLNELLPYRSFETQKEELEQLSLHFKLENQKSILWNKALISSNDTVFPFENMKKHWGKIAVKTTFTHLPFKNYQSWNQILEYR